MIKYLTPTEVKNELIATLGASYQSFSMGKSGWRSLNIDVQGRRRITPRKTTSTEMVKKVIEWYWKIVVGWDRKDFKRTGTSYPWSGFGHEKIIGKIGVASRAGAYLKNPISAVFEQAGSVLFNRFRVLIFNTSIHRRLNSNQRSSEQ